MRRHRETSAAMEQDRADGLARRISAITEDPHHPSQGSLPLYQDAYRDASSNAAALARQPRRRPRD